MNASVKNELAEGAASDFAADGVEAGDGDRVGRVVYDHIHTGGLLKGFDVAAIASDDASLHFFAGEGDHGAGDFSHMLGGNTLDGVGDQFAGTLFTFFTRFGFHLTDDTCHVSAGFFFNGGKEFLARIFGGQLRDLFELLNLIFVQLVDLVAAAVHLRLTLVQGLFALFHFVEAAVEFGAAFVEAVGLAVEFESAFLDLRLCRLNDLGGVFSRAAFDHAGL